MEWVGVQETVTFGSVMTAIGTGILAYLKHRSAVKFKTRDVAVEELNGVITTLRQELERLKTRVEMLEHQNDQQDREKQEVLVLLNEERMVNLLLKVKVNTLLGELGRRPEFDLPLLTSGTAGVAEVKHG